MSQGVYGSVILDSKPQERFLFRTVLFSTIGSIDCIIRSTPFLYCRGVCNNSKMYMTWSPNLGEQTEQAERQVLVDMSLIISTTQGAEKLSESDHLHRRTFRSCTFSTDFRAAPKGGVGTSLVPNLAE